MTDVGMELISVNGLGQATKRFVEYERIQHILINEVTAASEVARGSGFRSWERRIFTFI